MTQTFKRHSAELDTGFYGPGFIRGLKMAMNRLGRKEAGYSVSRTYGGMKPSEIAVLNDRLHAEPHPKIRDVQAKQGLAWLLGKWHTPRGTERKTNPFSAREENVLRNFDHFEIVDWYDIGADRDALPWYIPVYRVIGRSGNSFTYYAGSWQSGVPLTIVN